MSSETYEWLNQNTLIGLTDRRGNAWHYKASEQGAEPNHYPGFIPVEDVERRLFDWHAIEGAVVATAITPDGVIQSTPETSGGFKAIMRDDTGFILGVPKDGWQIHQYDEWLLKEVASLLDDDLGIGSAGLLRNGRIAWVQIEVPDSITTPSGVEFRPYLLAATAFDGSLSTTYKRCVQNVVCDNTMAAGLGEQGQVFKVRHTKYSQAKLADAREALAIVYTIAEDFTAEVEELTNTTVTDAQWAEFLAELAPVPADKTRKAAIGRATNKQAALQNLWDNDNRVAPWRNTAWGVVQAVNTADHHVFSVRGSERVERNQLKAVQGGFEKLDASTVETLATVLG
jgi:phage/plasmid-like protein (TIGR03299 family)